MSELQHPRASCAFLTQDIGARAILTPEALEVSAHGAHARAVSFMRDEVAPHLDRMEAGEPGLLRKLLGRAGEADLLSLTVPGAHGIEDVVGSVLATEQLGAYAGFAACYGAHTGMGMLPLAHEGTAAQKERWLGRLISGEAIATCAIEDPSAGSDTLTAQQQEDASFVLSGEKHWVLNAGISDLFVVFCQVDGQAFTAFLVGREHDGVRTTPELNMMGWRGASMGSLRLTGVRLTSQDVLGEVGQGHKIAFHGLNRAHFKRGVSLLGAAKYASKLAITHATQREAFGQPIARFGAINAKLGEMMAQLYALESCCYRAAGELRDAPAQSSPGRPGKWPLEDFAVEDAIIKVLATEVAGGVVDEALQIHGSMGCSGAQEIERLYRDVRMHRIFGGTNEINRMLIPNMILKKLGRGVLDLFSVVERLQEEVAHPPTHQARPDDSLESLRLAVSQARKMTLYAANQSLQKHMAELRDRQEILTVLADLVIDVYAMDSVITRTLQHDSSGERASVLRRLAAAVFISAGLERVRAATEQLITHLSQPAMVSLHLKSLQQLCVLPVVDVLEARRQLGNAAIAQGHYVFERRQPGRP